MVLLETWVEEKGWEKVSEKSPGREGVVWGCQTATKKHAKGRTRGEC